MKLKLQSPLSCRLSNVPLWPSRRLSRVIAALVAIVASAVAVPGLRASDQDVDLSQLTPEVYEWYPYEPMDVAVSETLELFGDVDDFGGGTYICTWESDRGDLQQQVVQVTGNDWISFKSRIAYRPKAQDVGARIITLTVQDPNGHTAVQTYAVNVVLPSHPQGSSGGERHVR